MEICMDLWKSKAARTSIENIIMGRLNLALFSTFFLVSLKSEDAVPVLRWSDIFTHVWDGRVFVSVTKTTNRWGNSLSAKYLDSTSQFDRFAL